MPQRPRRRGRASASCPRRRTPEPSAAQPTRGRTADASTRSRTREARTPVQVRPSSLGSQFRRRSASLMPSAPSRPAGRTSPASVNSRFGRTSGSTAPGRPSTAQRIAGAEGPVDQLANPDRAFVHMLSVDRHRAVVLDNDHGPASLQARCQRPQRDRRPEVPFGVRENEDSPRRVCPQLRPLCVRVRPARPRLGLRLCSQRVETRQRFAARWPADARSTSEPFGATLKRVTPNSVALAYPADSGSPYTRSKRLPLALSMKWAVPEVKVTPRDFRPQ